MGGQGKGGGGGGGGYRDDELESTRVWYNADAEQRRASARESYTEQIREKCGPLLVKAADQIRKKAGVCS